MKRQPAAAQQQARPARPPEAAAAPKRVPLREVAESAQAAVLEPAPATQQPLPETAAAPRGRFITAGRLSFVLVAVLLYYGWTAHLERYIDPNRGLGYALGIIGGTLMLVLLAYSLRKRWRRLEFLGSTPSWFNFHVVLGVVGPLCILYHSNFTTGATNSNVALFSMLTVAGSGVIGRYIYAHIHNGLHGRRVELGELQTGADTLRSISGRIAFVPELITRLESAERRLLIAGPRIPALGFMKPFAVTVATMRARRRLHRYVRRSLHAKASHSAVVRAEEQHMCQRALAYVDRRLTATRRVAEFEGYERLSSLWHSLHIPLIFVMVIAAIIHVIAVHLY